MKIFPKMSFYPSPTSCFPFSSQYAMRLEYRAFLWKPPLLGVTSFPNFRTTSLLLGEYFLPFTPVVFRFLATFLATSTGSFFSPVRTFSPLHKNGRFYPILASRSLKKAKLSGPGSFVCSSPYRDLAVFNSGEGSPRIFLSLWTFSSLRFLSRHLPPGNHPPQVKKCRASVSIFFFGVLLRQFLTPHPSWIGQIGLGYVRLGHQRVPNFAAGRFQSL